MKKILVLTLVAALSFASVAGAAVTFTATSGQDIGSTQFKCSTNVTLIAAGDTAGFNAVSGHQQGDKMYQGDSVTPNITESTKTKGTDVTSANLPTGYTAGATSS